MLLLDQNKLSQIIVNLLSETIKRSKGGTNIKVCMSWFPRGEKNRVTTAIASRCDMDNGKFRAE